ncbi:MAG: electron transfer flavoprotein subunit alpha/FixB family protein [Solirubrobacteraceae bacterium]
MSNDIFVLVEHHDGKIVDSTHELLAKARMFADTSGGRSVACLLGHGAGELAGALAADVVLSVDDPALAQFVPEAYAAALAALIQERDPRLVLIANTTVGIDVAAPLSARTGRSLAAYCVELELEGDATIATSLVYGGKLRAELELPRAAIASVVAGSLHRSAAVAGGGAPAVEDVQAPDLSAVRTTFLARREPEPGDVEIATEEILVSVGRGIGGAENIELAQELADALGGTVSASRPVTDAGWLPKSRQVGKSGSRVKPKLYLACGISGAPEHLEGIGEAELIIAINTDERAPIFDVADYGSTEDVLDLLPALVEQLEAARE